MLCWISPLMKRWNKYIYLWKIISEARKRRLCSVVTCNNNRRKL